MRIPAALKTQPRKGTSEDRLRLWLKVCEWPIADNYAVNIGVGALLQIVETVGDTDLDVSIDEIVGVEIPSSQIKRTPIGLVNPGQKFAQSRIGIPAVVVTHLEMQRFALDISLIGQQINTDNMPRAKRTDWMRNRTQASVSSVSYFVFVKLQNEQLCSVLLRNHARGDHGAGK